MLVAVLDGQLTLVAPGAPNPYAARMILDRTPESHTFIVRSSGAFATLPFGEHFTFSTGASGEVTGYVTSGARYVRKPPLIYTGGIERRKQPHALYTGTERRNPLQAPYVRVERRKQSQAPYNGVERRAVGRDRRGQQRPVVH